MDKIVILFGPIVYFLVAYWKTKSAVSNNKYNKLLNEPLKRIKFYHDAAIFDVAIMRIKTADLEAKCCKELKI